MKKNENETLQIEYPEVRQMKFNNPGYDYLITNDFDLECRIEYKVRDLTRKYDITEYQENHSDVFALRDENKELWFMTNKLYMNLCETHSAWPKHKSKRWQLTLNKFRKNASRDLYEISNLVVREYGSLEEFFA